MFLSSQSVHYSAHVLHKAPILESNLFDNNIATARISNQSKKLVEITVKIHRIIFEHHRHNCIVTISLV